MTRQIIRCLFGQKTDVRNDTLENRLIRRRGKMDRDVEIILQTQNYMPMDSFSVYVFGIDNYRYLTDKGFNCKLLDEKPHIYHPTKEIYRHKLEILKVALQDYEEVLYLDWDCIPVKYVDLENIWHYNTDFAANLMIYCKVKCKWRKERQRTIPNGGYLYMRRGYIDDIIDCWQELEEKDNDEIAYAKWLDTRHGCSISNELYESLYEPWQCNCSRKGVFHGTNGYFKHELGQSY